MGSVGIPVDRHVGAQDRARQAAATESIAMAAACSSAGWRRSAPRRPAAGAKPPEDRPLLAGAPVDLRLRCARTRREVALSCSAEPCPDMGPDVSLRLLARQGQKGSRYSAADAQIPGPAAGINVGGHNKVAMSDLRDLAAGLGHADVATYIQSGNLLFSTAETDPAKLADALELEIAARLGVRPAVVVISAAELAQVIADNPFPAEAKSQVPACGIPAGRAGRGGNRRRRCRGAASQGSRQRRRRRGRRAHAVPAHAGRAWPQRSGRPAAPFHAWQAAGTARNWATVTRLMAMLDAAS